tara:strand:+ start:735 stop:1133 length:399 start_codon:yes stop_codon:yes gene_type:complete
VGLFIFRKQVHFANRFYSEVNFQMGWTPRTLIGELRNEDKYTFRISTPQLNCHNRLYISEVVTFGLHLISTRINDMFLLVPLILAWSTRLPTLKEKPAGKLHVLSENFSLQRDFFELRKPAYEIYVAWDLFF